MNVLVFCVDEMRADHIAAAGNATVRTPNLDGLAARGTLFRRSYCNNPICMPARATMFTGLLPRDHGLRINGQALRGDLPLLPGILAREGYLTHASGKLHLTPWVPKESPRDPVRFPESRDNWNEGRIDRFPAPYYGFESVAFVGGHTSYAYGDYIGWLRNRGGDPSLLSRPLGKPTAAEQCYTMSMPEELHYNRYVAETTIDAMDRALKARRPFFIWSSFPDPHHPFAPPEPYASYYAPDDCRAPVFRAEETKALPPFYADVFAGTVKPNGIDNRPVPEAHIREMIARTYGMVTHLDAEIGRVLDHLDARKLRDDTVVIFLGDHGDMMGDHGLILKGPYTFSGCITIPTIVAVPTPQEKRDEPALGRVRPPAGADARMPVVSDALISQIDLLPTILDLCGVAMPGDRLPETPFQRGAVDPLSPYPGRSFAALIGDSRGTIRDEVVIENDDPTTGFRVRALVTDRYRLTVYPGFPFGELFDLSEDPGEHDNLWERKPALRNELTKRLLDAYSRHAPLHPIPPWNS